MEYRQLGKWGPRVSVLGLGSYLTIGFRSDESASQAMVRRAVDCGVNFFDTADAYNRGQAEQVLGSCLDGYDRSAYVLLTKVWVPMGDGPNDRGLSAKHIKEGCHASLRRLGTDYLDIYMCHRPDPQVPLEETIRAMDDLVRQGKILYWGVSEWPAWLMMKALGVARELSARPLIVNEPRYNLIFRHPEHEVFPMTLSEGIGNVVFSPLAHGMLTGKYRPGEPPPPDSRAADPDQNHIMMKFYWSEENKARGQRLVALAAELGMSPSALAIAWTARHPAVSSVILGTRTDEQLADNLSALDVKVTPDVAARLEEIYPAPPQPPVG